MAKTYVEINSELTRLARKDNFLARGLRGAMWRVMLQWWRTILPKHFRVIAYQLYPWAYLKRSKKYGKSKRRKKGHLRPMVFSGLLERRITQTPPAKKEREGSKSLAIDMVMIGTPVLNLWSGSRKKGTAHNFRKAITAVNEGDRMVMLRGMGKESQKLARYYLEQGRRRPVKITITSGGSQGRDAFGRFASKASTNRDAFGRFAKAGG